jgi:hypothetical protein
VESESPFGFRCLRTISKVDTCCCCGGHDDQVYAVYIVISSSSNQFEML